MVKEKGPKILVIDDDQEMREMIYNFLTYRGFYVKNILDSIKGLISSQSPHYHYRKMH